MDLIGMGGRSTAEKIVVSSTSLLAFALGAGEAHADLIITQFDSSQNATLAAGNPVVFGTTDYPDGFAAQIKSMAPLPGGTFSVSQGESTITTFEVAGPVAAGSVVDGSLTFSIAANIKVGSISVGPLPPMPFSPDGNYFFGLDITSPVDPFDPSTGYTNVYGWVEMTLTEGSPTLDAYAFEDTPDVGAPVPGDNPPASPDPSVPEPASLALFAIGGAAVLSARRRRQAR